MTHQGVHLQWTHIVYLSKFSFSKQVWRRYCNACSSLWSRVRHELRTVPNYVPYRIQITNLRPDTVLNQWLETGSILTLKLVGGTQYTYQQSDKTSKALTLFLHTKQKPYNPIQPLPHSRYCHQYHCWTWSSATHISDYYTTLLHHTQWFTRIYYPELAVLLIGNSDNWWWLHRLRWPYEQTTLFS